MDSDTLVLSLLTLSWDQISMIGLIAIVNNVVNGHQEKWLTLK